VGGAFPIWLLFSGLRQDACPAPERSEWCGAKTSKSPPPSAGLCPQKEFLFLSLPPLIFCFQKQKRNCNVKKIKDLQKYAKKNLHPYLRLSDE